ncbi:MAG: hypothetical protein KTR22_08435 [Flavobacteriaceae bacterium]|nr:hypothetical protein [Flavobacteriaceae bacterium]
MKLLESVIEVLVNPNNVINKEYLIENNVSERTIAQIEHVQSVMTQAEQGKAPQTDETGADTLRLINKLKLSLEASLKESQNVQNIIKVMFSMTFLIGFILIGVAIYFGWKGETFLATAFGSFGMLSIVALLLKDPPLKMQDSRSNYAQLSVGILAWLNDLMDKAAMAKQNQLFALEIMADKTKSTEDKLKVHKECIDTYLAISNIQIGNTVKLLNLIDEVAEPSKKQGFSLREIIEAERGISSEGKG